jgi:hypothetical protein
MKRANEFEEQTKTVIKEYGNVQLGYENKSVVAMNVLKQASNKNKLFEDARSPYLSPTGRQKKTEFVYHSPLNNIDVRIECKSRKTIGLIGEITDELHFVSKIPEKQYYLVLSDLLLTDYILARINDIIVEKGLQNKVIVGGLECLKTMLKERVIN